MSKPAQLEETERRIKCHSCGTVSPLASGFECPTCGSLVTEVTDDPTTRSLIKALKEPRLEVSERIDKATPRPLHLPWRACPDPIHGTSIRQESGNRLPMRPKMRRP